MPGAVAPSSALCAPLFRPQFGAPKVLRPGSHVPRCPPVTLLVPNKYVIIKKLKLRGTAFIYLVLPRNKPQHSNENPKIGKFFSHYDFRNAIELLL